MGNAQTGGARGGGGGGGVRGRSTSAQYSYGSMPYDCKLVSFKGALFESKFPSDATRDSPVEIRMATDQNTIDITPPSSQNKKKDVTVSISYTDITHLGWDHGNCEVKITVKPDEENEKGNEKGKPSFLVFTLENSIDLETDIKNRCNYMATKSKGFKYPVVNYIGMFAGSQKPKPFQRKRPNLSDIPAGKMPPLDNMRVTAKRLHDGSYSPCPPGESRRLEYAIQHIFEGCNYFDVVNIKGWSDISKLWSYNSLILLNDTGIILLPKGMKDKVPCEFLFEDIDHWICHDKENIKSSDSSIEVISRVDENGESQSVSFGFTYIRDVKHTLEYFWNKHQLAHNGKVKRGSTHGRPIVSCSSLSGVMPAPPPPEGSCEVVDSNNQPVRGSKKRISSSERGDKPLIENPIVMKHWDKVVVHQGWLLKKGGMGIGAAKNWISRYFVLFRTSQGHFLTYYSDISECPLYCTERNQRNLIDIAKVTFIRPGSTLSQYDDTPPHCFDIITTEREWTLCAESKENHLRWLQIISRAVDEDVAIIPDENLVFSVKAKVDPTGIFCSNDYSTTLKVSSQGVEVAITNPGDGHESKKFFWIYTDFFKWQLYSQRGKIAVLLNVFTDATFKKRNEFIFRTKDAVRLATAIEYFIEKFMSSMHMRLELPEEEGGLGGQSLDSSDNANSSSSASAGGGGVGNARGGGRNADHRNRDDALNASNSSDINVNGGMHEVDQEEFVSNVNEADLLNFDDDDYSNNNINRHGRAGSVPNHPAPPVPPKKTANLLELDDDDADDGVEVGDGGTDDLIDLPVATQIDSRQGGGVKQGGGAVATSTSASNNLIDDDDYLDSAPLPPPPPPPISKGGKKKEAAALTPNQIANHNAMLRNVMSAGSGPIYDDGFVKISVKIDVRQSQGRLSFQVQNISKYAIPDLKLVVDTNNWMRHEFHVDKKASSDLNLKLESRQNSAFNLMVECMEPDEVPTTTVTLSYTSVELGFFATKFMLPLMVCTFNEEVKVPGNKFAQKWASSAASCTEAKSVIQLNKPADPQQILNLFVKALKAGKANDVPGESDTVFYGACTIRTGAFDENDVRISIGCMLKVEVHTKMNAVRVTVRSPHPASPAAILESFKVLLDPQ